MPPKTGVFVLQQHYRRTIMHWITNALCAEVGPTLFYAEPNDNMMTAALAAQPATHKH